ncbi:NAD(P)/FAD-dependent oxidoreductase [Streptomyces sp. NPDC051561]|uniref:NAD(P)/FAD-dependent oxidoreductase n=1 Tax=Streptomyces sp. NPDC051561 TaxID=3365658 RepID=UPI00378FA96B
MKHRIVVLGAGYAGANAAGRLARRLHRDDVEITLVNADADFVERIRLHQVASGQDLPRRPLSEVFAGTGVRLREARVTEVDVERRTVGLGDSRSLAYDTLVYALGSTATDHGVPGVAEHAHTVAGRPGALRLRARLAELAPGASVLIAGGGLTGIEAATEIAEAHPHLKIAIAARGGVGDWLSDKAQRHLRAAFDRFGITLHENTDITRVESDHVITAGNGGGGGGGGGNGIGGESEGGSGTETGRIPAQVTVWTAGFTVHPIAAATTLEVDAGGRIVVDATMRSVSHPEVYAVGDAALAEGAGGKPLRMSCATASPMAWLAADSLAARLTGRKVPEKTIGYAAQCISLGRRDGILQKVTTDDRMTSTVLTGRTGARVKELICAATTWGLKHPTMLMPSRRRHLTATPVQGPQLVTR